MTPLGVNPTRAGCGVTRRPTTAAPPELDDLDHVLALVRAAAPRACAACGATGHAEGLPREVILCPNCGAQHVDGENGAEFATRAHHTHLCSACGHVWVVERIAAGEAAHRTIGTCGG